MINHVPGNINTVMKRLENGYGVGVSVTWPGKAAHAITAWGYIVDKDFSSLDKQYYKALIVSDSDSDMPRNSDRRVAPNKLQVLSMVPTPEYEYKYEYMFDDTWYFDGYDDGILNALYTLRPYSDDLPKETDTRATKDKINNPDLAIGGIYINPDGSTIQLGENVVFENTPFRIYIKVENNSDIEITTPINYLVEIRNSDGEIVYSQEDAFSEATLNLNNGMLPDIYHSPEVMPHNFCAGQYTAKVMVMIPPEKELTEAYYYNNLAEISFSVVKPEEQPDEIVHSGVCGDNAEWTFSKNGTLTISGEGDIDDYTYSLPSWYTPCDGYITNVVIEDGITSIGKDTFQWSESMLEVTIPLSLRWIRSGAFSNCPSLTDIYYQGTREQWNDHVFCMEELPTNVIVHFIDDLEYSFEQEGTAEDPYLIPDLKTLEILRNAVNSGETFEGKHFKLTNDLYYISSEYKTWIPIGRIKNSFKGTFDGNGHIISDICVPGNFVSAGLFGCIDGGAVKNLAVKAVKNVSVMGSSNFFGGICGYNIGGTIENCSVTYACASSSFLGGICGYNVGGTVKNCSSTDISKSDSEKAGCICGGNIGGTIENCCNIESWVEVIDICSENDNGTVTNCYSLPAYAEWDIIDRFASGEIAYLLQNNQKKQFWGQSIGVYNSRPELTSDETKKVIKADFVEWRDRTYAVFECRRYSILLA